MKVQETAVTASASAIAAAAAVDARLHGQKMASSIELGAARWGEKQLCCLIAIARQASVSKLRCISRVYQDKSRLHATRSQ